MRRLVIRRLLQAILVAALAASASFTLILLAPGDPMAAALDHASIDEVTREVWRTRWALDQPGGVRWVAWLRGVARLDPGPSVAVGRPIMDAIGAALPYTVLLMGTSITLSVLLGVWIALAQAQRAGTRLDRWWERATLVAVSAPEAGVALLLLGLGAVSLGVFPPGGAQSVGAMDAPLWWRIHDLLWHLALPALTLTIGGAAVIARHERAALLAVAVEPFVLQWRARGVAERRLWRHLILRHALAPLIALLGLALPALVGGAVIVERIFAWPGMGTLVATGVARRDAPLVATCVALSAVVVVLGSTAADLMQRWLDPRLRDDDV